MQCIICSLRNNKVELRTLLSAYKDRHPVVVQHLCLEGIPRQANIPREEEKSQHP